MGDKKNSNVLASALIRRQGASSHVLHRLREGQFTLVFSTPLMVELIEVLSRPVKNRRLPGPRR